MAKHCWHSASVAYIEMLPFSFALNNSSFGYFSFARKIRNWAKKCKQLWTSGKNQINIWYFLCLPRNGCGAPSQGCTTGGLGATSGLWGIEFWILGSYIATTLPIVSGSPSLLQLLLPTRPRGWGSVAQYSWGSSGWAWGHAGKQCGQCGGGPVRMPWAAVGWGGPLRDSRKQGSVWARACGAAVRGPGT